MRIVERALVVFVSSWVIAGCARGPMFSARLLDRDGDALPTEPRAGREVALGKVGDTYDVEVENASQQDVAVVVSVDGLDIFTGRPETFDASAVVQRGAYILSPMTHSTFRGFVVARGKVSTFRFVDEAEAYATQLGLAKSLGQVEIELYAVVPSAVPDTQDGETPYASPVAPAANPSGEGSASKSTAARAPTFGDVVSYKSHDEPKRIEPTKKLARFVLPYAARAAAPRIGTAAPPPGAEDSDAMRVSRPAQRATPKPPEPTAAARDLDTEPQAAEGSKDAPKVLPGKGKPDGAKPAGKTTKPGKAPTSKPDNSGKPDPKFEK